MEMQDITDWASSGTKTLELTHDFGPTTYKLIVGEFIPVEGDMLHEAWFDKDIFKTHPIPPFAIVDMKETTDELWRYVDKGVAHFMKYFVGNACDLVWNTFVMAFKHSQDSHREYEKTLLRSALRLWVTSRMTSHAEKICGGDKLGTVVEDPSSPYYRSIPVAPLICAQLEIITLTQIQRPLRKTVLETLQAMIKANNKCNWFTMYLTLFILLHSCALTTRRDAEYAAQMGMSEKYANPESIQNHHTGVLTMLAYFHWTNKGKLPFKHAEDPAMLEELATVAELNEEQVQFVKSTSLWVKAMQEEMERVRRNFDSGHELYFVSQLFDDDWKPPP